MNDDLKINGNIHLLDIKKNNKEILQKNFRERYQNLSEEEKKNENMVVSDIKISPKIKNKFSSVKENCFRNWKSQALHNN